MFDEKSLSLPARRNVKGLTESLATLATGDLVSAKFATARYGSVAIAGAAVLSASVKSFYLAGLTIENGLKPDRYLQTLETIVRASTPWDPNDVDAVTGESVVAPDAGGQSDGASASSPDDEAQEREAGPIQRDPDLGETVTALEHGTLVEAVFHVPVYGDFTIAGVAVWSEVGEGFLVGSWILGGSGTAAPSLRRLAILAPAGDHGIAVPPKITAVGDELPGL